MPMNANDLISIEDALTRLSVAPAIGGSLVAWTRLSDGLNLLRPCPPEIEGPRQLGCYPLVPWSNRIANGGFDCPQGWLALSPNASNDPLPIHGSAWQQPWAVLEHSASQVLLELQSQVPFAYRAQQRIGLENGRLSIELHVTHLAEQPCWHGLGLHPYLPRTAATQLQVQAEQVWLCDEGRLPTELVELPPAWNFGDGAALPNELVDNGFTGWDGRALITQADLGYELEVHGTGSEFFLLFCPLDKPFFCFEPVSHPVNAHHLPGRPGLRLLAKGESCELGLSLKYQTLN
ncbi:aldose 1-epimerase [Pseudomonas turukhanskensis]|nr:aldose 1-epimerase [Pseudomonas turukhanskensis]